MLPNVPPEIRMAVMSNNDPVQLSYFLASVLDLGVENEQKMLEADTADDLLTLTHRALDARSRNHADSLENRDRSAGRNGQIAARLHFAPANESRFKKNSAKTKNGEKAEAAQLRERLETADLPEEVRKEAERELKRMEAACRKPRRIITLSALISNTFWNCRGKNRARKNSI